MAMTQSMLDLEEELDAEHLATVEAVLGEALGKIARLRQDSVLGAITEMETAIPGAFWLLGKGKLSATEPMYGAQIMFGSNEVLGAGEAEEPAAAIRAALNAALTRRRS